MIQEAAVPPGTGDSTLTVEISGDCPPALLELRLAQLDREWDVDRAFLAAGACAGLVGVLWGGLRNRLYLALPMAILYFIGQRAVGGTCGPLEMLRRLGFRTTREIQDERAALQALGRSLRRPRARRARPSRTRNA